MDIFTTWEGLDSKVIMHQPLDISGIFCVNKPPILRDILMKSIHSSGTKFKGPMKAIGEQVVGIIREVSRMRNKLLIRPLQGPCIT